MDKYQQNILSRVKLGIDQNAMVSIVNDVLNIKQSENAYIEQYILTMELANIKEVKVGNVVITSKDNTVSIPIDFNNQDKILKIFFVNEIVEPIELNIEYIRSSKEEYDKKISEEKKAEYKYESNARIVVNIFGSPSVIFNPCCEDYSYTEVEFIATDDGGTTKDIFPDRIVGGYQGGYGGCYNPPKRKAVNVVLQRKRNEDGCNYVQFTNIGQCGLKAHIYQYNKKGQLLVDYEI